MLRRGQSQTLGGQERRQSTPVSQNNKSGSFGSSSSLKSNPSGSRLSAVGRVASNRSKFSKTSTGLSRAEEQLRAMSGDNLEDITLTDLFLADDRPGANGHKGGGGGPKLLPLPPGLLAILAERQEQNKETLEQKAHNHELMATRQVKAVNEIKVQEYFKVFATWPRTWPQLEESRERLEEFLEIFNFHRGLLLTCGERIKCSAFVVICPAKIGLRSEPSSSTQYLIPDKVIHPGQLVVVDSILVYNKVKFLKLRQGGWAFEWKGHERCMAYLSCVETGLWWYRVVSREYAEIRLTPSFSERARSGYVLCPNEVCVVALRCRVDDRCWMQLADGRGWIFEARPPHAPRSGPRSSNEEDWPELVMAKCEPEDQEQDKDQFGYSNSAIGAVEVGLWEYEVMGRSLAIGITTIGSVLEQGEKVCVDLRVPANGQTPEETSTTRIKLTAANRIWLRLEDGRGWVPKSSEDGSSLLKFVRTCSESGSGSALGVIRVIQKFGSAASMASREWHHGGSNISKSLGEAAHEDAQLDECESWMHGVA